MHRSIPFPLASGRYEVGPSMRRFGQAGQGFPAEEGHFQPDDLLAPTLKAKLAVLRRAPGECHLADPSDQAGLRTALGESFRLLAAEHPGMVSVQDGRITLHHLGIRIDDRRIERMGESRPDLQEVAGEIYTYLVSIDDPLRLLGDALGLAVQEDLAIVRGPAEEGGPDLLEWLHVCLPSGWVPAEKIGRSFGAVHEPVAHSEQLVASQGRIIRAMIQAGPFVRYVWGIHRDGELCHNPRLHQSASWRPGASPAELAEQAWFRVERQTTHGFPAMNRALFTIRYWVEPLTATAADPWRRERLCSALAAMDETELRYKGLLGARDGLVRWLA